jgi:hypothetical protein
MREAIHPNSDHPRPPHCVGPKVDDRVRDITVVWQNRGRGRSIPCDISWICFPIPLANFDISESMAVTLWNQCNTDHNRPTLTPLSNHPDCQK